jgi:spermidine/putrescine transport system permease protein
MRRTHQILGLWTFLVLIFLYAPIALLVIYSFNRSRLNISWQGFTLAWYRELFHNAPLMSALTNSLIIATFTTILSVAIGTAGAWLMYRHKFPFQRTLATLIFVPMVIPEIIMGVSLLIFFALISTWGNQLLQKLGIRSDPLGLGFVTVIISHVTFCFPFVLLAIQARLAGLDPSLEEAALDLGATPRRAFFSVIVPYLLPAIVAGGLMSFTLSLDELIVTYFVTSPASATLPIKIFGMAKVGLSPMLNAISTLFIVATMVLVITAERLRKAA